MDAILTRVTQSAFNYALKSGVPIVAGYTFRQCSRLLQQTPKGREREQIARLHNRLESKIKIISPAIDMIELISARGNTSLESAVTLTRDIRLGIQELGIRLSELVDSEDSTSAWNRSIHRREHDLAHIISDMESLLYKIDDAIPLINLAITTSGAALASKLPSTISPSRLLQASTFLTAADLLYSANPGIRVKVGPTFHVALYMLFVGHSLRPGNDTGMRDTTWKEVMHKAQVKLTRLPLSDLHTPSKRHPEIQHLEGRSFKAATPAAEFAYELSVVEDLDDDRVHTFDLEDLQPQAFDGVQMAGMREAVPVHEIAKIFYADTGKILNIQGDADESRPILLLKRDVNAEPPRRMLEQDVISSPLTSPAQAGRQSTNGEHVTSEPITPDGKSKSQKAADNPWRLPAGLDPEWMALEVFAADDDGASNDSDTADDEESPVTAASDHGSLLSALTNLALPLRSSPMPEQASPAVRQHDQVRTIAEGQNVKTSLSLLEMLIKLAALQQFRQESHLVIEDELLNLFLQDTSTTGHGVAKARRQRTRRDALQRVGFDPYDDSPIKPRTMHRERSMSIAKQAVHQSDEPRMRLSIPSTP